MTTRYPCQIGFVWIVACWIGCGDPAQGSGVETGANVRLFVPSESGDLPDRLDYEFVCNRDGPRESQVEGSLEPPNANPGSGEIEHFTWTASVELPPGECLFRLTTPIQFDCNSCWVSESVTIDRGIVNDVSMVLLCTLSFCETPSGEAEISISVTGDPGASELSDQLAYTLACDGPEADSFASIALNGKLEVTESSHPPRWQSVFKGLPAGRCNLNVVASDRFGVVRCQAAHDFDIHVDATTVLSVDLDCRD